MEIQLPDTIEYALARLSDQFNNGEVVDIEGGFQIQQYTITNTQLQPSTVNSNATAIFEGGAYHILHLDDCTDSFENDGGGIMQALRLGMIVLCGANFENRIAVIDGKLQTTPFVNEP